MVADLHEGPNLLVRPIGLSIIQASAALAQVIIMPRLHGMGAATSKASNPRGPPSTFPVWRCQDMLSTGRSGLPGVTSSQSGREGVKFACTSCPTPDAQPSARPAEGLNRPWKHLLSAILLTRLWKRAPRIGFSPQLSHTTPWCACLVLESPPEKAVFLAWLLLWELLLTPVFCTFLMAMPASTGTTRRLTPMSHCSKRRS